MCPKIKNYLIEINLFPYYKISRLSPQITQTHTGLKSISTGKPILELIIQNKHHRTTQTSYHIRHISFEKRRVPFFFSNLPKKFKPKKTYFIQSIVPL